MYVCMYMTGLVARLTNVVESDFAQITYTEAVALLQREIKEKKVCMYCMYLLVACMISVYIVLVYTVLYVCTPKISMRDKKFNCLCMHVCMYSMYCIPKKFNLGPLIRV